MSHNSFNRIFVFERVEDNKMRAINHVEIFRLISREFECSLLLILLIVFNDEVGNVIINKEQRLRLNII